MAQFQQKQAFTNTYSPIIERENEGRDDITNSTGGCSFFRSFCCGWNVENDGENNRLLRNGEVNEEPWLLNKLKKVREFSELIAGPRWKNLLRKIGKLCNGKKGERQQFQYSPESYALNFNGGEDDDEDEDYRLVHSFSARYGPQGFNDQEKKALGL